jgi:hypothetical protein
MAISNILKRKIAIELQDWIFLGIRTGMRRGVQSYRALLSTNPTEAVNEIKRAIDLPQRARARINQFIATYTQAYLVSCISMYSDYTISELNTELTSLENYATGLYNRRINNSESWGSLATDIETNITLESQIWTFPLPGNYKDIWGE